MTYDAAFAAAEAAWLCPPWDRPGACTGDEDCGCPDCTGDDRSPSEQWWDANEDAYRNGDL